MENQANPLDPRLVRAVQRISEGIWLRRLRKQHRLTLQKVADRLGISKSLLSLVECGRRGLQPEPLEKLYAILRPDLSEAERKELAEARRRESEQEELRAMADSMGVAFDYKAFLPWMPKTPGQEKLIAAGLGLQSKRVKRLALEYGSVSNYELILQLRREVKDLKSQNVAQMKQIGAQARRIAALEIQARSERAFAAKLVTYHQREIRKLKMQLRRSEARAWARRARSRREAEA